METCRFWKSSFLLLSFFVSCAFAGQIIMTDEYTYDFKTWPELRGKSIDEVATKILNEYPRVKVKVRPAIYGISSEIEANIVLLYQNDSGIVLNLPETVIRVRIVVRIWPEVVGMTGEQAKDVILQEVPDIRAEIVPEGSLVTDDRDLDRVRIYVNSNRVVVDTPRTG